MNAAPLRTALALALATTVSLGLARFSYALLLPPMRADLGWSYLTSGAMNTVNAAGYLAGALLTGRWLARHSVRAVLVVACAATGATLVAHGLVASDAALYGFRFLTGGASAVALIAGALLAARLAHGAARGGPSAGLVVGIYYGGTGIGIGASALVAAVFAAEAGAASLRASWQDAWIGVGVAALVATAVIVPGIRTLGDAHAVRSTGERFRARPFGFALAAYFLFGVGYIGYMTFVVTLLREWHLDARTVTAFYATLGVAVCVSPWLWSGLLQRSRGGLALAVLNGLLALATVLPVASVHPAAVFASGLLFGAVFLALVASTTALVRHNLAPEAWAGGIAFFTTIFAAGQIVGPTLVGWIADGSGGLRGGLACSAVVLAVASALASCQRPLPRAA